MSYTITEFIVGEIADRLGADVGTDIHLAYSGRRMRGAECVGYSGDEPMQFTVLLALAAVHGSIDADGISGQELVAAIDAIGEPHRDNLGSDLLYYWPNVVALGK